MHAVAADSLAKDLGRRTTSRVTLIRPDGKVLADTDADPKQMENHRFRPEVQAALNGETGSAIRTSASVFEPYLYVAQPSKEVASPLTQFRLRERESRSVLLLGGVAATLLALALGFVFMRRIVRPLETVGNGLLRLERGEFGARLEVESADEIGQLARTLNRVQERLESTIQSLTTQRNQREAILSSMVEGLIAVDGQDRILLVNSAGRGLLGLGDVEREGRSLRRATWSCTARRSGSPRTAGSEPSWSSTT
jgi:two-component system phosphate regulon sensor histidine kinase PhoR